MKSTRHNTSRKRHTTYYQSLNEDKMWHMDLHLPVSEYIAECVVSQLIKEVIHINQKHKFNNYNIPEYCFDFLRRSFIPLIRYEYMQYDNDSDNNNSHDIMIPHSSCVDLLCSSQINVVQDKTELSGHIKEVSDLSERNEERKLSSQKKKTFINFGVSRTNTINNINNNNKLLNNIITKTKTHHRNIKEIAETFPYYDIKDKINIKDIINQKELDNISQLRKEIIEQHKKENNTNNINSKKNYLTSLYSTNHTNSNNNTNTNTNTNFTKENQNETKSNKFKLFNTKHLFDNKYYTFDSNGEVIKKTNIKVPIKDGFIEASSQSKLVKEMINDTYYNNSLFPKKKTIMKEQIHFNENENTRKTKQLNDIYKLKRLRTLSPPSGDNFNLIRPEIGVIITYDDDNIKELPVGEPNVSEIKVKSGGLNFNLKYNRFSMRDYNQIIEINSQSKPRTHLNTPINTINNNNNNINSNSKTVYNNFLVVNANNNNTNTKFQLKLNKSKSTKCISINENVTSNLKCTLDTLDLNNTHEYDSLLYNNDNNTNREDVFKTIRSNIKKNNQFNQTNDFGRFNYNYNNFNTLTSLKRNNSVTVLTPSKAYLNKTHKKNGFLMKIQQSPRVRVVCKNE